MVKGIFRTNLFIILMLIANMETTVEIIPRLICNDEASNDYNKGDSSRVPKV